MNLGSNLDRNLIFPDFCLLTLFIFTILFVGTFLYIFRLWVTFSPTIFQISFTLRVFSLLKKLFWKNVSKLGTNVSSILTWNQEHFFYEHHESKVQLNWKETSRGTFHFLLPLNFSLAT